MYEEIYELIDNGIQWGTLDKSGRAPFGAMDQNFLLLLSWAVETASQQMLEAMSTRSPLKLRIGVKDASNAEMLGRKMLLCSDLTVFDVEDDPSIGWAGYDANSDAELSTRTVPDSLFDEATIVPKSDELEDIVPYNFVESLVTLRPLIEARKAIVIPKHRLSYGTNTGTGLFDAEFDLHLAELKAQLLERVGSEKDSKLFPSLEIKLPHLRHIPLNELIAFREHNELGFQTFHRHIRALMDEFSKIGNAGDEASLLKVIDEVDYEVRRLGQVYREARKKSLVLSAYDLAYVVGGLVLYGVMPHEISKLLTMAIGGAKIKSITDRLMADNADKDSPFYVAWSLHKEYGLGSDANEQRHGG